MGIFQEMVEVVVRVPRELGLRFDGQDMRLKPNYDAEGKRIEGVQNLIPSQCIYFVLDQNVRMGTEDPLDPTRYQSLVGIIEPKKSSNPKTKRSWHDCSFIDETKDENGEPVDPVSVKARVNLREMLEDDPQVQDIKVKGRKLENGVKLPSMDNGGTLAVRGRG